MGQQQQQSIKGSAVRSEATHSRRSVNRCGLRRTLFIAASRGCVRLTNDEIRQRE